MATGAETFYDILEKPRRLAAGIKGLQLSSKQQSDLAQLASTRGGIHVTRDSGQRVRGETVYTCSRVGAMLTRHFNCKGPGDKMMWMATLKLDKTDSERWVMRPQIKEALKSIGWI